MRELQNYTKLVYIDADIFVPPTCPNIDRYFDYNAPAAALEFNQNQTKSSRQCGLVSAPVGTPPALCCWLSRAP